MILVERIPALRWGGGGGGRGERDNPSQKIKVAEHLTHIESMALDKVRKKVPVGCIREICHALINYIGLICSLIMNLFNIFPRTQNFPSEYAVKLCSHPSPTLLFCDQH